MTGDQGPGIDPDDLALCLRVLAQAENLPSEHPDAIAVRRATGKVFKTVKEHRRAQRREAVLAADRAVTASTATGSPDRIDDIAALGVPAFVVRGRDDNAWPHEVQDAMAVRLDTEVLVVEDSAHSPAVENPAGTVRTLLPLLRR